MLFRRQDDRSPVSGLPFTAHEFQISVKRLYSPTLELELPIENVRIGDQGFHGRDHIGVTGILIARESPGIAPQRGRCWSTACEVDTIHPPLPWY